MDNRVVCCLFGGAVGLARLQFVLRGRKVGAIAGRSSGCGSWWV